MPALLLGDLCTPGVKIINANPDNPRLGIPRADGLYVLFDFRSGRPTCIVEAAYLSALRTAAVSTLAAKRLALTPAHSVAVIGAGVLGRMHIELITERLEGVETVALYDTDTGRAARLAEALRGGLAERGVALVVHESVEATVTDASVLVTATTTTTSYLSGPMLPAGTVAINVSLDDLDETALLETDRLFVDDWELIVADDNRLLGRLARAGRVVGPDETPTGNQRRVDGTLGELLAGHCQGRGAASDKVVVNPFGMAITDIALARLVHQVGVQRGLGTVLARGEVA